MERQTTCRHLAWLGRPRTLASLVLEPPSSLLVQSWAPRRQWYGTVNADALAELTARPKSLRPRWFYDHRGGELVEEITRQPGYCPTHTGRAIRFAPFHVGPSVLGLAGAAITVDYPGVEVEAVAGDFTEHVDRLPREGRCLIAFLGSTLGNLGPGPRAGFLREPTGALSLDDALLLDTDLVNEPVRLVQDYADVAEVTARFNRNDLHVLDRELGADFDSASFAHVALWTADAERFEMRLRSLTDQVVHVPEVALDEPFAAGEEMRTEVSAKFRREWVEAELAAAGLRPTHWWTEPAGNSGVSLSEQLP